MKTRYLFASFIIYFGSLFSVDWTGAAGNGQWFTSSNWAAFIIPNSSSQSANFPEGSATQTVNLGAPATVNELRLARNLGLILNGSTLTLQDAVFSVVNITSTSSSGAMLLNNNFSILDDLSITPFSAPPGIEVRGNISGAFVVSAGTLGVVKLLGNNSYLGDTSVGQADLQFVDGAIPAGTDLLLRSTSGTATNLNSLTPGNAFRLEVRPGSGFTQGNNFAVYITSLNNYILSGTGGFVVLSSGTADTSLFSIGTTSGTSTFDGPISGGATNASFDPAIGNRLIKTLASTQVLGGNSTYTSRTFVQGGTLSATHGSALGAAGTNSAVFVQNGATLRISNDISLAKTFRLNGGGVASSGALNNNSGANSISGNVRMGWSGGAVLASDPIVRVEAGSFLTLTGVVEGANNWSVAGAGTLSLAGSLANTFSGDFSIGTFSTVTLNKTAGQAAVSANMTSGGTLLLLASNQIADTSTVTITGGLFDLNGNSDLIDSLTLNGGTLSTGVGTLSLANGTTALTMRNTTANGNIALTGGGDVVFDATNNNTATINADLDLGTNTTTFSIADGSAAIDMVVGGEISNGGLTKTGSGTLQLTGVNTYTNLTTVSAGVLALNASGNSINSNVLVNGGTLRLDASDQIVNSASVEVSSGALNNASFSETIDNLTLSGGNVTGVGTLTLTNATTALTFTTTGQLNNAVILTGGGKVVFSGVSGTGAIANTMDLGGNTTEFNIADGSSTPDMFVFNPISNGGLTKTGAGTLRLDATNTYTGTTTINAGTLLLNANLTNAIVGPVVISGGTLEHAKINQIADTSSVTLDSGTWNLAGFAETVSSFTFNGGTYTHGGTTLGLNSGTTALTMRDTTLSGNISITGGGAIVFDPTNNGTATISGNVDLGSSTIMISVPNGSGDPDMLISGILSNSGGINKTAAGTLELQGANTFSGTSMANAGTLLLNTTGANSIPGNLEIGGATVTLAQANQIADTATVTLNSGLFNLAGNNETISTLVINGGSFDSGVATLQLTAAGPALTMRNTTASGNITLTGGGSIVFDATNNGTATIDANLNFSGNVTPFTINDGTAATDMVVSSAISNGGLTKDGAGTLQLSGANTYPGTTTVNAGILALNTTGSNAISGPVVISGGTLSQIQANQISNSSSVTLNSGVWNLNGFGETVASLTFNGGTLTQGGSTLTLASAGTALTMRDTTLSGNINLTGGGSIAFDATNNGTGEVSGNVDLGGNSTTIDVADGTASIDMRVSGIISNGGIVKTSAGNLELTGLNTYAGNTTINGGTLTADSSSIPGNVINNAILVFDQQTDASYDGVLSGTGTAFKKGLASLSLTQSNTVGGTFTVEEGLLSVNGPLGGAGDLIVQGDGILGGTGPISKNVQVFGTLNAGNSPGVLEIIGDVVQGSGSVLELEVTPTANDLVDITGSYTIQPNAELHIIATPGIYPFPFSTVVVSTTGGVIGTFDLVTTTLPLFAGSLVYEGNDILLELLLESFSILGFGGNAKKVGDVLDAANAPPGSDLNFIIENLGAIPTVEGIKQALLLLQPSALTSLSIAQQTNLLYVRNAIFNRLDPDFFTCCFDSCGCYRPWIALIGAHTSQKTRHQNPGYSTASPGVVLGIDSRFFCDEITLGGALGYTYTNYCWKEERGDANLHAAYGSVYASWERYRGAIKAAFIGAYNAYEITRRIHFFGDVEIDRKAKSCPQGAEFAGHLRGEYLALNCCVNVLPYLSIDYQYLFRNEATEKGAKSLNLKLKRYDADLLTAEAGVNFSTPIEYCDYCLTPFIEVGASREQRFTGRTQKSFLAGQPLNVVGFKPSRTVLSTSAGILYKNRCNFELSLFYKGRYVSGFRDNSFYAELTKEF